MTLRSSKKMRSTVSAVLASSIGVGGTSRLIGVVAAFGVSGEIVMVSCVLLGVPRRYPRGRKALVRGDPAIW